MLNQRTFLHHWLSNLFSRLCWCITHQLHLFGASCRSFLLHQVLVCWNGSMGQCHFWSTCLAGLLNVESIPLLHHSFQHSICRWGFDKEDWKHLPFFQSLEFLIEVSGLTFWCLNMCMQYPSWRSSWPVWGRWLDIHGMSWTHVNSKWCLHPYSEIYFAWQPFLHLCKRWFWLQEHHMWLMFGLVDDHLNRT